MADQKITELDANSSPASTDLIATVDDVGGSPITKKTTIDELDDYLKATTKTLTNKTIDGDDNTLQDIPYSAIKEVAWSSYTPSLTNITRGNGVLSFKYMQIGKTVFVRGSFVMGSTSSVSGVMTFSLPVTAQSSQYLIGNARIYDPGVTSYYIGALWMNSTTSVQLLAQAAGGTYVTGTGTSSSVPMTWAQGDYVYLYLFYEAA